MRLTCGDDELDVWVIDLTVDDNARRVFAGVLTEDEQKRAERFVTDRDRRRFVFARSALRTILSSYIIDARTIAFDYGVYGKPFLADDIGGGIRFNLSHSGDIVLCAVTRGHDVGVDIEEIRDDMAVDRIAAQFFSHEERQFVSVARNPAETFTRVWVRKEACLKASGRGIGADLAGFSVIAEAEADASITVSDDGVEWTIQDLPAPTGYLASVATREALKIVMRECAEL